MHYPRHWRDAFETESRDAVNTACNEGGLTPHWIGEAGGLRVTNSLPATRVHPDTGEKLWFNQSVVQTKSIREGWKTFLLHQLAFLGDEERQPYLTRFGDGGKIPRSPKRVR